MDTYDEFEGIGQADGVKERHRLNVRQLGICIGHGADDSADCALHQVEVAEQRELPATRLLLARFTRLFLFRQLLLSSHLLCGHIILCMESIRDQTTNSTL